MKILEIGVGWMAVTTDERNRSIASKLTKDGASNALHAASSAKHQLYTLIFSLTGIQPYFKT